MASSSGLKQFAKSAWFRFSLASGSNKNADARQIDEVQKPSERSTSLAAFRQQCGRCLWSGKLDQLLNAHDGDCQYKLISARKWRPDKVYACFCCSLLSGFLASQGLLGLADVQVMRSNGGLYLKRKRKPLSTMMMIYTSSSRDGLRLDAQVPCLPHCPMISSNTSSDQALSWVQEQINACTHSHAQCQRKQGEFLPTRLLSVRPNPGSQDIRLIESKNLPSSARYIALSHCWGKIHMQCLTKKENLLQQLECVPWSSLTRTFQDAVDFTRRLGIDYIWIDSMCIVQNDTEDWLREASMMFSVYGNAHVTLVGVHAGDGSVGLYSSTAAQRASPKTVAFNGHDYQLYTREATTPFHDWRQISSEAPLFGRAWCFQELIISSRVVFFTKQELLWECWSNASCECTYPASNSTQDIDNLKVQHFAALADAQYDDLRERVIDKTNATSFRLSSVPSAAARGLADEQLRREYRVHQWHSVVEQYSELRLTKYTDRLPAFGGVAQHYHEAGIRPGEKYLAGLWSGSIIDDLVWWAMEFGRKRLGAGVAPSWSWASVTGAVQYKQVKVALAKVLSAECEYGNTGPFSVVSGGMLGVEGPTLRLTLLQKERTRDWSLDDPEYGELTGLSTFLLDDEADSACWNRRTIDAVAFAEAWDGQTIYILLAAKDHKVDVYTRVGILFQDDTDDRIRTWREKLPRRSFRVV